MALCSAENPQLGDDFPDAWRLCGFPDGHAGAHSWALCWAKTVVEGDDLEDGLQQLSCHRERGHEGEHEGAVSWSR